MLEHVLRIGDGLILLPEQQHLEHLREAVGARLTTAGLTTEELLATLPEARNRVYARRYGSGRASKSSSRRGK